jgi:hypothetical protein
MRIEVRVDVWLEWAGGRMSVLTEPGLEVAGDGLELVFDLPVTAALGRHRLVANVDPVDEAPAGAIAWFVTTREAPPVAKINSEYAELTVGTLWLNYGWVVTDPGDQRRTVLDVKNNGPDTARNVRVRISTLMLRVDQYGPMFRGQYLQCRADANALVCDLGDLLAGEIASVELYVTPLRQLTAVPLTVESDTASSPPVSTLAHMDLEVSARGPQGHVSGTIVDYVITVTNQGDEMAGDVRLHGALGPWPAVAIRDSAGFDDPGCEFTEAGFGDDDPLQYQCWVGLLGAGQSRQFVIQATAPEAAVLVHVIEAVGFPQDQAGHQLESFRGNNSLGLISIPSP